MENGDETLASHADQAMANGGVKEEDQSVTILPAKPDASAAAELEVLRAAKLDLERQLADAARENHAIASEAHRLEGLITAAQVNLASAEHAAATAEEEAASLGLEVKRLKELLASEKENHKYAAAALEAETRKSQALAAELEAARLEKLALEKEIEDLKASANAAAEEKEEIAAVPAPTYPEVAWPGMAASAAAGAAAMVAVMAVCLHLKR